MAPSMWYSFGDVGESFGAEMGTITVNASDPSLNATKGAPGSKEQDLGRMLMRGSWNAELWGVLEDERSQGLADGTDFLDCRDACKTVIFSDVASRRSVPLFAMRTWGLSERV